MGYVSKNLMPNEDIVHQTRLHRIIFLWPALVALFGLVLLFEPSARSVGAGLVLLALLLGFAAYLRYRTSEFAVTDRRVIFKQGVLRRSSIELLLSKVEGVQVDQGLVGRLLDYGSIVVTGTGGSKDPFKRIAKPMTFRRHVQTELEHGGQAA